MVDLLRSLAAATLLLSSLLPSPSGESWQKHHTFPSLILLLRKMSTGYQRRGNEITKFCVLASNSCRLAAHLVLCASPPNMTSKKIQGLLVFSRVLLKTLVYETEFLRHLFFHLKIHFQSNKKVAFHPQWVSGNVKQY